MYGLLTVMLGGALGSGARYALGTAVTARMGSGFPWHTLAVNLLGGLAMGVLAGGLARSGESEPLRLLLGVGMLGGFTTFSAFSLDTVRLFENGGASAALAYIAASVAGSLLLTAVGLMLVRGA